MLRAIKPSSFLKQIPLCVLSAVLLTLSFSSFNLWVCAWCAFVPFFLVIEGSSKRNALLLSYLTGVIFWSANIYWLIHVTLAGQVVLILYVAVYYALFGLLVRGVYRKKSLLSLLVIPAAWVLLEYVRSHLFTGFPWTLLGFSQYRMLPIIQIADTTGAWGVSFLVMFVNVAIFEALRQKEKRKNIAALVVLVFAVILGYGVFRLREKQQVSTFKVAVVQGNIPQELKWSPSAKNFILTRYSELTREAAQQNPDLIIWPEASSPDIAGEENVVFTDILSLPRATHTPLLIGSVVNDGSGYFNSALFIDESGKISQRYDKVHLVPFGEYIPLRNILPFLQTIVPIGDINRGTHFTIFKAFNSKDSTQHSFAVLICFEDLFPELSRKFVTHGAQFLAVITNDAWYKKSSAAAQHFQASVFRAVENRVPVLRAANTGISGFIAPNGKIISLIEDKKGRNIFVSGYRAEEIALSVTQQPTWYTRFGDVFIFLLLGCLICGIYFIRT